MKVSVKSLAAMAAFLFVGGSLWASWMLYKLPEDLVQKSNIIDMEDMNLVNPILSNLNIAVGLALMLGIATVLILWTNQKTYEIAEDTTDLEKGSATGEDEKVENEEEMEAIFKGVDLDQINIILAEKEDNKLKLNNVLNKICNHIEAVQGALYVASSDEKSRYIELIAAYAYHRPESEIVRYEFGEGLAGQVAKEGKLVNINEVPSGYIKVISGLGNTSPNNLLIIPLKKGDVVIGVAEIASFKEFRKADISYLEKVFSLAAEKTIGAGAPTPKLPKEEKAAIEDTVQKESEKVEKEQKPQPKKKTASEKKPGDNKANDKGNK